MDTNMITETQMEHHSHACPCPCPPCQADMLAALLEEQEAFQSFGGFCDICDGGHNGICPLEER